jgi:hypothetical protein
MVRDLSREEFAPKAMERDKTKEFPRAHGHDGAARIQWFRCGHG